MVHKHRMGETRYVLKVNQNVVFRKLIEGSLSEFNTDFPSLKTSSCDLFWPF